MAAHGQEHSEALLLALARPAACQQLEQAETAGLVALAEEQWENLLVSALVWLTAARQAPQTSRAQPEAQWEVPQEAQWEALGVWRSWAGSWRRYRDAQEA